MAAPGRNGAESYASPPDIEVHSPASAQSPGSSASGPSSGNIAAQVLSAQASAASRIRRRNRMITSCLECRRRKLKCDKSHPCVNCTKFRRECVFLSKDMDHASQQKLTEIKEKVGSLERLLERDVARPYAPPIKNDRALPDDAQDYLPGAEDERDLEPTPLAVVDAAYDNDAEADDDLLDLGIQIGRMRITERIGGFFRPKMAAELAYTLSADPNKVSTERDDDTELPYASAQKPIPFYDYLKPGPAYIAPASGFFLSNASHHAGLSDFLPSRLAADRLIKQYFSAVHPIAKLVHRPSFEREYESFWEVVSMGMEPPGSAQAIVFAAMFSGVVSMDESAVLRDFGVSKASLIENFQLGTETALGRANFLRTTKVETLQGFVMYMIPLCREEVSRSHSVLVGAAIRMAECMGLHRDGETYGLNPLETQVRRLIWNQLCILDIRTCEAQGPRPGIRREDFDTKLPLNVDDNDLHATGKPPTVTDRWTDTTFTLIRFEANEMVRTIWVDRPRIERRKISLTAVLAKIETFRKNMAAKYDHLIDERIPLQKAAKILKALMVNRPYIMVLHRYHNSTTTLMPERLRQIMLSAGTILLETAVALETLPELALWKWYVGAYHQYHTAFLLLVDVFFYSNRKEADRIWPCLDYVFQTDRSKTRDERARAILRELHEKTAIYQEKRKMRAPSSMQKHVGQRPPRKTGGVEDDVSTRRTVEDEGIARTTTTIGRAPLPNVVYAGVSNGETLWALPPNNYGSPSTSSDAGSLIGQMQQPTPGPPADDVMAEIDWEAFDAMFPPDQVMADFSNPNSSSSGFNFDYLHQ